MQSNQVATSNTNNALHVFACALSSPCLVVLLVSASLAVGSNHVYVHVYVLLSHPVLLAHNWHGQTADWMYITLSIAIPGPSSLCVSSFRAVCRRAVHPMPCPALYVHGTHDTPCLRKAFAARRPRSSCLHFVVEADLTSTSPLLLPVARPASSPSTPARYSCLGRRFGTSSAGHPEGNAGRKRRRGRGKGKAQSEHGRTMQFAARPGPATNDKNRRLAAFYGEDDRGSSRGRDKQKPGMLRGAGAACAWRPPCMYMYTID